MTDATPDRAANLQDHEARMAVVRQVSRWHLGYDSWAELLVDAYLDPSPALEKVEKAKGHSDGSA